MLYEILSIFNTSVSDSKYAQMNKEVTFWRDGSDFKWLCISRINGKRIQNIAIFNYIKDFVKVIRIRLLDYWIYCLVSR